MKLIKPSQISGEIMTLFDEADEKVIIVSPYFKIQRWEKLIERISSLQKRRINTEIYVREDQDASIQEAVRFGLQPLTIPNLHTKIYLNEKEGIVSSMNLLYSSDTRSIDIAYKTETEQEYAELFDYYERYIKQGSEITNEFVGDWNEYLSSLIVKKTGHDYVKIEEKKNQLVINSNNKYFTSINWDKRNYLQIDGILSGNEYDYLTNNPQILKECKFDVELEKGGKGYYNLIIGYFDNIKSKTINSIAKGEEQKIAENISDYIAFVERFKSQLNSW